MHVGWKEKEEVGVEDEVVRLREKGLWARILLTGIETRGELSPSSSGYFALQLVCQGLFLLPSSIEPTLNSARG